MTRSVTIGVDYDGTVVENFSDTPLPGAIQTLKDLKLQGHALFLWTCREGQWLEEAVQLLKANGIEMDGVNECYPKINYRSRKLAVDVFIDDRNIGGFVGWDYVREYFGLPKL